MGIDMRVISLQEFRSKFQSVHDAIFSGREHDVDPSNWYMPFADASWERILVPNNITCLDDTTFKALTEAAIRKGDDKVIVTESESLPHHERAAEVFWDQKMLRSLSDFDNIAHFELHAFGMSASWGLMCYYDEFSLLGGTSTFMATFLESAGGMQRVKERFIQHALEIWVMDPTVQVEILRSVGWSFSDA